MVWEFPYPEELKTGLMIALLQARTVLTWLRNAQAAGVALECVEIVPRADADAALTAIGGTAGPSLLARAREVELAIYRISAALMPPDLHDIDGDAAAAYRPFDVIESFRIVDGDNTMLLRPLVIFDDAHSLHPMQLAALRRWLARRELKVARSILTRLDALTPSDVLWNRSPLRAPRRLASSAPVKSPTFGCKAPMNGAISDAPFRKMAKDMSGRYLSQMDVFNRRGLKSLGDLLSTAPETIATGKRQRLAEQINALQRRNGVSAERRRGLEQEIANYLASAEESGEDLRLAMLQS